MATSESILVPLLLASNAVLLAMASIALVRIRQRLRRFEEFWQSPTGAALLEEKPQRVQIVQQPCVELEQQVEELQSAMQSIRNSNARSIAPVEAGLPIENAMRMARHGASIEELIRSCGLNVGEARLLHKLHGMNRAAAH